MILNRKLFDTISIGNCCHPSVLFSLSIHCTYYVTALYFLYECYKNPFSFPANHLFRIIIELFAAGTETTGTSLDWAFLYMIIHPEIQQKCFEEIKQVISKAKWLCFTLNFTFSFVPQLVLKCPNILCLRTRLLVLTERCDFRINHICLMWRLLFKKY